MMLPPISRNTDGRNHARKDIYDRKRHKAKEEKSGNPYGQMDHPNLGPKAYHRPQPIGNNYHLANVVYRAWRGGF